MAFQNVSANFIHNQFKPKTVNKWYTFTVHTFNIIINTYNSYIRGCSYGQTKLTESITANFFLNFLIN